MTIAVEAWTIPSPDDEESCIREMVDSEEFADEAEARRLAWQWLEEGFWVRMFRR